MSDVIPLIAGVLQAGSSVYSGLKANKQADTAEAQRNQQYTKLNDLTTDPAQLLKNILRMKRSLSESEKDMITQSVSARLISQGKGGAPGLIQEAVDQALLQADDQLFQEAAQSYLGALGLPISTLRSQPQAGIIPMAGSATGSFGPGVTNITDALKKLLAKKNTTDTPGLAVAEQNPDSIPTSTDSFSDFTSNTVPIAENA